MGSERRLGLSEAPSLADTKSSSVAFEGVCRLPPLPLFTTGLGFCKLLLHFVIIFPRKGIDNDALEDRDKDFVDFEVKLGSLFNCSDEFEDSV